MLDAQVSTKQLMDTFKKLPAATQRKAMRPALRKGAGVVRDAARLNLKSITSEHSTGIAAKSVIYYAMKKFRGMLRYGISIRKGTVNPAKRDAQGAPVRVGLYASVLEYGKANQPPRSWLRKAASEKTEAVYNAVAAEANKRMDDAIRDAQQ